MDNALSEYKGEVNRSWRLHQWQMPVKSLSCASRGFVWLALVALPLSQIWHVTPSLASAAPNTEHMPEAAIKRAPPTLPEIYLLVSNLVDPDPVVRQTASQRLTEAGPTVLKTVPLIWMQVQGKPGIRKAIGQLIIDIQSKDGIQPVRANGLEFRVVADLVWQAPPPGGQSDINFALQVTNIGEKTVFVRLLRAVAFEFRAVNGAHPVSLGGRDTPSLVWLANRTTLPLAKGESYLVDHFGAKLCRSADGKDLCLKGEDGCTFFRYQGLKPGWYFLRLGCSSGGPDCFLEDGTPEWKGEAVSPLIAVQIK